MPKEQAPWRTEDCVVRTLSDQDHGELLHRLSNTVRLIWYADGDNGDKDVMYALHSIAIVFNSHTSMWEAMTVYTNDVSVETME